jgi:hypothetical protein
MPRYQLEHTVDDRLMASVWFARASDDGARLALMLTASRIGLFMDRATDQALTLSRECGAKVFRLTAEQSVSGQNEERT